MHTNAKRSLARIEAAIGEPLKDFLFEQYDRQGLSFREISQGLAEQGISVSYCTLYRWYYQLLGLPRSIREARGN
jgi:transposase-like protein